MMTEEEQIKASIEDIKAGRIKQVIPSFEEQFPSLCSYRRAMHKGASFRLFSVKDISAHCLDKQRVREAINKIRKVSGNSEWDNPDILTALELELGL